MPSARALFNKKFTAKLKPRTGKEKDEDAHIKGSIEFILDYNKDEVVESISCKIFNIFIFSFHIRC